MRMMKKVMTGMSLVAAALTIFFGGTASADAANTDVALNNAEICVNGAKQSLLVDIEGKELLVSFDAIKEDKTGKLSLNAKAKWDLYDIDGVGVYDETRDHYWDVRVDLSSLNTKKNAYIALKTERDAFPYVYQIPAHAEKLSGKYKIDKNGIGYLEFKEDKNTAINELDLKDGALQLFDPGDADFGYKVKYTNENDEGNGEYRRLEYRTANTNTWTEYNAATFNAKEYERQGATLYFRYAGGPSEITDDFGEALVFESRVAYYDTDGKKIDDDEIEITDLPEGTVSYGLRTLIIPEKEEILESKDCGRFAGAEIKIKISKEAAAPAATIDYDNGAFKVKKDTEYRHLVNDGDGGIVWAEMVKCESDDPEANDNGYECTFPDTTANDAWIKTSVAKTVPIDITKDGIFEVRNSFVANKKVPSKVGIYVYKAAPTLYYDPENPEYSGDSEESEDSIVYLESVLTKAETAVKNSDKLNATITNSSDTVTYLIYIGKPDADTKPAATVKPGKSATVKNLTPGTTTLYVRSAGDKKAGIFRSNACEWRKVGKSSQEDEA